MEKNAAKLLNIMSEDFSLLRKGKFFTTDEHDSLVIDPRKGLFFWNSKGIFGDVLDYLVKVRKMNHTEAVCLINETSEEFDGQVLEIVPEIPNPALVDIFYEYGKDHRAYWYNKRGYTDETIDKWKLGFTGLYHVIPIFYQGKFINLQCRGYDNLGNKITKPFYQGGQASLFNIDGLPDDRSIPIYIGESPAEAIILSQYGYGPALGLPYGAMSWDQEWARLLFDRERIYWCFDNDEAGRKGMKRGIELLKHNSYCIEWNRWYKVGYDCTDHLMLGNGLALEEFVPAYIYKG